MILYNLFPLLAGPFPTWKAHFNRASAMGFNWIACGGKDGTGKNMLGKILMEVCAELAKP